MNMKKKIIYRSFTYRQMVGEEGDRTELEEILMKKCQDAINEIYDKDGVNNPEVRITNVETILIPVNSWASSQPYLLTIMHTQITYESNPTA